MLDMFIFETLQSIQQLEQSILRSEKSRGFEPSSIDEIFRIMHTIKGSSSVMLYTNIASLTHTVEDVFYFLRKENSIDFDHSQLTDILLDSTDFIKIEINKIQSGDESDGDPSALVNVINSFLALLKQGTPAVNKIEVVQQNVEIENVQFLMNNFEALLYFEDGCEMENIRAFTVIHKLKEQAEAIH